ncbi:MAG: RDD family protein [Pirellulaceae bacterium]|nr:RDD family protein [Pirellulaceae bacterium]
MHRKNGQLDSHIPIITPENISFDYQVAGPFRRAIAFVLDLIIRGILILLTLLSVLLLFWAIDFALSATPFYWIVPWFVSTTEGALVFLGFVGYFLLDWFYSGLFETYMNGQTPAKRLLQMRVVSIDGQPITGLQAIMRNLLRYVDLGPAVPNTFFLADGTGITAAIFPIGMVGFFVANSNSRCQRLGDLVCQTMVVVEERQRAIDLTKVADPRIPKLAELIPPDFVISHSLAKAIAAYMERRKYYSNARRHELAAHLAFPLLRQFGLPSDTSYDLFMCALYYQIFLSEQPVGETPPISQDRQWPSNPFEKGSPSDPLPTSPAAKEGMPTSPSPTVPPGETPTEQGTVT